jgi:hypothetical protein
MGRDTGPVLAVIPSHGTHRRNIVRILKSFPEFEGYKFVFVSRTFAPASIVKARNWVRRRLAPQSDTVVVSRASENLVIDGFTERIIRWNASQIVKFTGDIRVIVFGETAGEVLMLANQLLSLTSARTCLVPEGLGVVSQTRAQFAAGGTGWQTALGAESRQGQGNRRPQGCRGLVQSAARSVGKFWWRVRRFVFLVSVRPGAPKLLAPGRFDYLASDWLEELPAGFTAATTLTPLNSVSEKSSARRAVFLHGPYDFEEATWLACLSALDLREIQTLVIKQHRNPLGFGALEAAARALLSSLEIEVLLGGNIEEYFSRESFALVAGIDSSALFAASQLLPESRIVSTLDTLGRCSSNKDLATVARYRKEFDLFRAQCSGRIAFV